MTGQPAARRQPQALRAGDVLLPAELVPVVRRLARVAVAAAARDGIRPSGAVAELLDVLTHAQRSSTAEPTEPLAEVPGAGCSQHDDEDSMTIEEVAAVLGCSESYARRLCRSGAFPSAGRTGDGWRIDRADVADHLHTRQGGGAA